MSENPLRILDSKSSVIQDILKKAPQIEDFIDEASKNYQINLLELL